MLSDGQARIKVETSPVMRGAVYPAATMITSEAVTEHFGFAEATVLAFEDLYGGKLVAALDRQHPRDLFDVKLLYENEGLTDDLFRTFLVYVAGSRRPMHELMAPEAPLRKELYDEEFVGMTRQSVTWDTLIETRHRLHVDIGARLNGAAAAFLLSLRDAEPDFSLIGVPEAVDLPAIRWKLMNLERLKQDNPNKQRLSAKCWNGSLNDTVNGPLPSSDLCENYRSRRYRLVRKKFRNCSNRVLGGPDLGILGSRDCGNLRDRELDTLDEKVYGHSRLDR